MVGIAGTASGEAVTMQLKKLELERVQWSTVKEDVGKVMGKIVFDGELGEVHLKLNNELCHRLFLVCAEGIVGVAKEAATALVCEAQATIAKDCTPVKVGP